LVRYYSQCVDSEIFMTETQITGEELYQRLTREEIGHVVTKE